MPLIIAHRGANKYAPQNTLSAFSKAVELSADGIETDVHLTKDGKIVICHNYTIDETSNGKGFIDDMTLEELRKYDFGSYFSRDFEGTLIPELYQLIEIVKDMTLINIEIKAPKKNNDLVKRTLDEIHKHGIEKNVIVSCFNPECIRLSKEIAPEIKTGFLYETGELADEVRKFGIAKYCSELKTDAAHPEKTLITKEEVDELHKMGMAVNPWTVDERKDIERLTKIGCDALITNVPDICRKVVEEIL